MHVPVETVEAAIGEARRLEADCTVSIGGGSTTGLGKALKSTVHPLRTDLPIALAAEGPKNVALAAEICDGCALAEKLLLA